MTPAQLPTWHTPAEVAVCLKVSRSYVYALIARGEIGHIKIGRLPRISDEHVAAYIAGLSTGGSQ